MVETNFIGLTVILVLLAADVIALFWLQRRNFSSMARALWALVILLFPAVGVIAFIIATQNEKRSKT